MRSNYIYQIATIKRVFLKAPYQVLKFKEIHQDLNQPPEPILTKWDTMSR